MAKLIGQRGGVGLSVLAGIFAGARRWPQWFEVEFGGPGGSLVVVSEGKTESNPQKRSNLIEPNRHRNGRGGRGLFVVRWKKVSWRVTWRWGRAVSEGGEEGDGEKQRGKGECRVGWFWAERPKGWGCCFFLHFFPFLFLFS